ncbi:MAG: HDOD domain-containing protein, partial [Desulfuromonadales bacterium]|nr:HDOD domain-containing protein [Desulfuromonadales bacterium]
MNTEKPLMQLIEEHLAGDLHDLPVFHSVAVKLQQMLSRRDFRIDDIIEQISEDQSLSGQVLKVANSSFYAGLSKVATIKDAVVRLGAQEIANLAMMASQLEYYKSDNSIIHSYMQGLWSHALSCAVGAKWLARKSGYVNLTSEAFMGGLLHDIGKLALLKTLDDIHHNRETNATFSETLINEVLERMHEAVGLRLLQSWSLPESYCSIAVNHHRPDFDNSDILLIIVRLANLACDKVGKSITPSPGIALISAPEAQCLGVNEIILAELEIVVEDAGS